MNQMQIIFNEWWMCAEATENAVSMESPKYTYTIKNKKLLYELWLGTYYSMKIFTHHK